MSYDIEEKLYLFHSLSLDIIIVELVESAKWMIFG